MKAATDWVEAAAAAGAAGGWSSGAVSQAEFGVGQWSGRARGGEGRKGEESRINQTDEMDGDRTSQASAATSVGVVACLLRGGERLTGRNDAPLRSFAAR